MGNEIPGGWPGILGDGFYYAITIDFFDCDEPVQRCKTYMGTGYGCVRGDTLKHWIANDGQCTGRPVLIECPFTIQRLVSVSAPFPTWAACALSL